MNDFWRKLLYRWFVQYNPLYLVSAMLVLGGTIMTSRALATEGSLYGPLGVAAIAEVYALALIGGAALLTRIGQRRPAVMLALLTALYQCDLTLHTETCVQLGVAGLCAAAAWLALFGLKLFALGWAMRVRLSLGAFATAIVGATALVIGPFVVEHGDSALSGALVAGAVFVLGVVCPRAEVTSLDALDSWGQTVLRRTLRAIWALWGGLLSLHALFWASNHHVPLSVVLPVGALLGARYAASEGAAWVLVAAVLAVVGIAAPGSFAFFALLAAITLVLRAYGAFWHVVPRTVPGSTGPYRAGEVAEHGVHRYERVAAPLTATERARHLTGALVAFYLALWTAGWSGGAWPAHAIAVDLVVLGLALALALYLKRWITVAVPTVGGAHAILVSGVLAHVPRPHSALGWGSSALILGFALLLVGLVTSYRLRRFTPAP